MLTRLAAELDIIASIDHADLSLVRAMVDLHEASALAPADVVAKVGFIAAMRLAFCGDRFDLAMRGIEAVPAFVVEALDAWEGRIDLVAWPIGRPREMATLHGVAVLLGEGALEAYSPTSLADPLRVHRTAEGWLRAGCTGVVPICRRRSAQVFVDLEGAIEADDDAHGADLFAARQALAAAGASILVREAA